MASPVVRRCTLLAATLLGCNLVTEPLCGCSPIPPLEVIVYGTVSDTASVPVAGARVVARSPCAVGPFLTDSVSTDAAGRFRYRDWSNQSFTGLRCFRVWANPLAGSGLVGSDTVDIEVIHRGYTTPDSTEIRLRLR